MGETVARQISQEEKINFVKDTVNTHELIISNTVVPNDPSYKDVVVGNKKQPPLTSRVNEITDDKVEKESDSANGVATKYTEN